jgi:hypothetical protein
MSWIIDLAYVYYFLSMVVFWANYFIGIWEDLTECGTDIEDRVWDDSNFSNATDRLRMNRIIWDIWLCKFRIGSDVYRGNVNGIFPSCRSMMRYCWFIAKLFMETLSQILNCFVDSFQQPGFSVLSINSTKHSSGLMWLTDHSMSAAASSVEKDLLPDSSVAWLTTWGVLGLLGIRLRLLLLASYRIWSTIASFEDSWNLLKLSRFIEWHYPKSGNTSESRTTTLTANYRSKRYFDAKPRASINQISNGAICRDSIWCWKLNCFLGW